MFFTTCLKLQFIAFLIEIHLPKIENQSSSFESVCHKSALLMIDITKYFISCTAVMKSSISFSTTLLNSSSYVLQRKLKADIKVYFSNFPPTFLFSFSLKLSYSMTSAYHFAFTFITVSFLCLYYAIINTQK